MHRAAATGLLALTSVFAFIRLLPMSDTDKDIEIWRCATTRRPATSD